VASQTRYRAAARLCAPGGALSCPRRSGRGLHGRCPARAVQPRGPGAHFRSPRVGWPGGRALRATAAQSI